MNNDIEHSVRTTLLIDAWDRANAAARAHPVKGRLLRLLDRVGAVVLRLTNLLIN